MFRWLLANIVVGEVREIFKDRVFDTIIHRNSKIGEAPNMHAPVALINAGSRGAVFSWDTAVPRNSADATTAYLAQLIADGADAEAAMTQMDLDGADTAQYQGITARLQLYQETSQNLRARDVATTYVEGFVGEPGVSVTAVGTPEDGMNDRIENVAIRIDAVNRGEEDTTKVTITVDGRPLKVIQDGSEVEEVYLGANTVRQGAAPLGSWQHHRVDLDQAILPFDLQDEDVTQGRGHVWEVTVEGASGGPTVHRIDPVVFRLGSVRIINPNTAFPVTTNEEVRIDGETEDGSSETYELIVRVEHMPASASLDEYAVDVSFDGTDVTLSLTDFEPRGEGTFVYAREIDVGDFDAQSRSVPLSATLTRQPPDGEEVDIDDFNPSQIILVLDEGGLGDATIVVGGQAWEFELISFMGSPCLRDEASLLAAGAVDGDQTGTTFSANLTTEGGELVVDDAPGNQRWMANADREDMTVLHLVPDGHSQIDDIAFDGRTIRGQATFIETVAFRNAWSNKTPYPDPVTGSFEIRCPSGS